MPSRSCLIAAILWLTLLSLSLALSVLSAQHDTLPGDLRISTWSQGLAFPGETPSDIVRAVTSTQVVLAVGGLASLGLWLMGYRRQAICLAGGLLVLPLLQFGIKEAVDRPRPSADLVELRASFSSPSFPSGHVMSPTYLHGLLAYLGLHLPLQPHLRGSIVVGSILVLAFAGTANVYLGVHWPSDVLGGYAWGLVLIVPFAWATGAGRLARRSSRNVHPIKCNGND